MEDKDKVDLHGRAGRKKHPDKCHFHPKIKVAFAAWGIREIHLPPAGHDFNPQEEVHRWIQKFIAKWRPDNWQQIGRECLYGPQTYEEVEIALNAAIIAMQTETKIVRREEYTLEQTIIHSDLCVCVCMKRP